MTVNDVTVHRIRRRLETVRLDVPDLAVLEEIVAFIDDDKLYVPFRKHTEIVDRAVTEALGTPVVDNADAYAEGYAEALDDIKELAGATPGEETNVKETSKQ